LGKITGLLDAFEMKQIVQILAPQSRADLFQYLLQVKLPNDLYLELLRDTPLEYLDIKAYEVSDEGLMKIADFLPNLRYLGLTTKNNKSITIKGLRYVAQHCPNLSGIAFKFGDLLNRLTIEELSALLGDLNCENWRVLSLRGSTFDASDEKEVELFKEKCHIFARHCPNIRVLDLGWITALPTEVVHHFLQRCPDIESVDLGWTSTPANMISIIVNKLGANLKLLNVDTLATISSDLVREINEKCPNLESLDLNNLISVHEINFTNLKQLKTLKLSGCRHLADADVRTAISCCTQLERLSLAGLSILTDAILADITEKLPNLKQLDVSATNFSAEALEKIEHVNVSMKSAAELGW
jgi:hypothetical protein